jgi:Glycosyltransferase Family 4
MRIIYHHRTQLDDAQGIHVRAIVRAFEELGHEVEVISPIGSRGRPPKRTWRIDTGRLPPAVYEALSLGYNLYGYRRLARALQARGPDLIYERYAPNAFCARRSPLRGSPAARGQRRPGAISLRLAKRRAFGASPADWSAGSAPTAPARSR